MMAYSKVCTEKQWPKHRHCGITKTVVTVAADLILNEMKRRLVVPSSTRWNSTYDSIVILNELLQKNRGCVHKVMSLLKLHLFSKSEIKLLKEYALVMSSLAKALEKIQGEN